MEKNKTGKYLKYAIGEIILVVIGILIALSINNWNQNKLDAFERQELISKLHEEFKANKKAIKGNLIAEDRAMSSSIALMDLMGLPEEKLLRHNLDSLLFETFPSNEIAFANNAVNNILQNGRLNLFKDDTISTLLNQWSALAEIRKIRFEKLDSWNNNIFLPYLLPFISFKEMDSNANLPWGGKSKVKPNYYPLFQNVAFENLLDNSLWLHKEVVVRLEETEKLIDEIIEVTKPK
tara:strand:- start:122259 stop:122966 length:708 start_codon:yes stop_codon:yes gene_type:complete